MSNFMVDEMLVSDSMAQTVEALAEAVSVATAAFGEIRSDAVSIEGAKLKAENALREMKAIITADADRVNEFLKMMDDPSK